MGDDISKNYKLNHLISEIQVTPNTAYKTFASVASQIFVDGSINWGRVVMLFYFAYKLALQVLNQIPLIDIIIGWVTKFVKDRISTWISNQGGWVSIFILSILGLNNIPWWKSPSTISLNFSFCCYRCPYNLNFMILLISISPPPSKKKEILIFFKMKMSFVALFINFI